MDPVQGNCTLADFAALRDEQATARGDFPGPCPLVWNDVVVDEVQIAQASVSGAHAVTLSLGVLGPERLAALREAAAAYGLAVVTQLASGDEIDAAVAAGLDEFAVLVGVDADEAIALRPRSAARPRRGGGRVGDEAEPPLPPSLPRSPLSLSGSTRAPPRRRRACGRCGRARATTTR